MTLLMVAVILLAGPFAFFLTQVINSGPLSRADKSLANSMHVEACTNAAAVSAARVISFLGSTKWLALLVALAVAFLLLWRKEPRLAIFAVVTTGTGSLLNSGMKILIARERPKLTGCQLGHPTGLSFPSGHAMNSTIVYGVLVLVFLSLLHRHWQPVLVGAYAAWLLAMSWARMTLGAHYLSDVLGGIVLGAAWLAIGVALFQAWRKEAGKPPADVIHEGVEPEAEFRTHQNR